MVSIALTVARSGISSLRHLREARNHLRNSQVKVRNGLLNFRLLGSRLRVISLRGGAPIFEFQKKSLEEFSIVKVEF